MLKLATLVPFVLVSFAGCSDAPPKAAHEEVPQNAPQDIPQTVQIEILKAEEHLGHNINESGRHTVWYDGCRARLVDSGEPFVIYWVNGLRGDTPYEFEEGRKYTVRFTGEIESGVMGYEGKCIDLRQVVGMEETP